MPATTTGQPFRTERGAVNVLHIELYFTGFKITGVNTELSFLRKLNFYIVEYSTWRGKIFFFPFLTLLWKTNNRKKTPTIREKLKGILAYFIINTVVNRHTDSWRICFGKVLKHMSHIRNTSMNLWILKLSMYFSHLLSLSQRNYRGKSPSETVWQLTK